MHKIEINKDSMTITIDGSVYELLDENETYFLFRDKMGVQEIRKDGYFDYEIL